MWLPDLADTRWVLDLLSRHAERLGLPADVATVELVDVRLTHPHRPGSPLCRGWATYVATAPGTAPVQLYLKGYPDAGTAEEAWQQDRAGRPTGRSEHLAGDDVVVWRFPEDPSLPALPGLLAARLGPADVPPAVAALWSAGAFPLRAAVVRYQPEASATLRVEQAHGVDAGGPTAFAKHLAAGSITVLADRHEALWSMTGPGEPLRVAEPLAADAARRILWTRGVPGDPLAGATPPAALPAVTSATGALLAALHRSGVAATPAVSVDGLLAEMRKKAAKIARAHPAAAPQVGDLVSTSTQRRRGVLRERRCALHGDFHLDQLVATADGPVLVDLDSMVTGPPELDLAEFVVDLALRELPHTVVAQAATGLLSAYAAASGTHVDAAALGVCADAEFLNRCYRHLRRHTPGWEQDLEDELGRYAGVAELFGG